MAARRTMTHEELLQEVEECLERMNNFEPLTRQELCDYYGIRLEDFPKLAQANLKHELEVLRKMVRVLRNHDDEKSVTLVMRIDARSAQLRKWIAQWSEIAQRPG
jgi:hypothetical protein